MALRELEFGTYIRWFNALNSTVRGLGVWESAHDQDPDQEKYTFLRITLVPVDQIGHVRTC
jgi:hypothetical protein